MFVLTTEKPVDGDPGLDKAILGREDRGKRETTMKHEKRILN
jgi:hypothetical protein